MAALNFHRVKVRGKNIFIRFSSQSPYRPHSHVHIYIPRSGSKDELCAIAIYSFFHLLVFACSRACIYTRDKASNLKERERPRQFLGPERYRRGRRELLRAFRNKECAALTNPFSLSKPSRRSHSLWLRCIMGVGRRRRGPTTRWNERIRGGEKNKC